MSALPPVLQYEVTFKTCYFSPVIAVPLTVNMSALPPVLEFEVTFKTCQLLVLLCAVGEVGVCCNFVPIPAVQFMLTAVNIIKLQMYFVLQSTDLQLFLNQ